MTNVVAERLMESMLSEVQNQSATDPQLIQRAQTGCAKSFEELVRRHHLDLRQFLIRRTGNLTVADDLAQEVLVAAMQQLSTLKETASFQNWLLTMARNKAVDYIRKISRERKNNQQMAEFLVTRESISRIHKTTLSDSSDVRAALGHCISKLAPKAHHLLTQFYFESRSAEVIARETSQKSSSVRMALLRIRKSLARCIRQQTGTEL